MRLSQEARENAGAKLRGDRLERKKRTLRRKRQAVETQVASLRSDLEAKEEELRLSVSDRQALEEGLSKQRAAMGRSRKADHVESSAGNGKAPARAAVK
jgi:SMC interacting uncharacterized protein involved in chromosome segregation